MIGRAARILVVASLAVSALLSVAGPAGAGVVVECDGNATNAPDGRFKRQGNEFQGDGFYSEIGSSTAFNPGASVTYIFRWKNVDDVARNIRVSKEISVRDSGFSVHYFLGSEKVNAEFKGGGSLLFPDVAPGASTQALKLVIANVSATSGLVQQELQGRYGGADPTLCDAMGVVVEDDD